MKVKLSDYVVEFLAKKGVRHVFIVAGGASIHILHSLDSNTDIMPVCTHHEQAGAMAADAYARVTGNVGCAVATSGPGATNMITGIAGAWFDSIPVIYITGQVTSFRLKGDSGVRQFGFQETDIIPMVAPITKYCVQIHDPSEIRYELEKAFQIATTGRPGPILIDIPDDFQRSLIETNELDGYSAVRSPPLEPSKEQIEKLFSLLENAKRPTLIFGHGVRIAHAEDKAVSLIERLGIPVLTSWGAKDLLPADHPLNAGVFGTHGTRAGNFTVQNSDLVITIGARLSTRETGSPLSSWAREAKTVVVDIDPAELKKFTSFNRPVDLPIQADAGATIDALLSTENRTLPNQGEWLDVIKDWQIRYPICSDADRRSEDVNPYALMEAFSETTPQDAYIFADTGCAVTWLMQGFRVRSSQRIFHDFNNTAMGWALPAALAGALATNKPIICLVGDGSFMMNLQELATIVRHDLPVKIILIDNDGYAMIRQTELQWLGGVNVGSSTDSGLGFPDFSTLARSFGIPSQSIFKNKDARRVLRKAFSQSGPAFVHIKIGSNGNVVPLVAFGYPIEDSEPHLPRKEFLANMIVDPMPKSLEEIAQERLVHKPTDS